MHTSSNNFPIQNQRRPQWSQVNINKLIPVLCLHFETGLLLVIESKQNGAMSGSMIELSGSGGANSSAQQQLSSPSKTGLSSPLGSPTKESSPPTMHQNNHQQPMSPNKEKMKAIAKEIQHRRGNSPQKKNNNSSAVENRNETGSPGSPNRMLVAKSDLNLVSHSLLNFEFSRQNP